MSGDGFLSVKKDMTGTRSSCHSVKGCGGSKEFSTSQNVILVTRGSFHYATSHDGHKGYFSLSYRVMSRKSSYHFALRACWTQEVVFTMLQGHAGHKNKQA